MKRNLKMKHSTAGLLAAACLLQAIPAAQAAPPAVETDEAVYVNLDYYGALQDMRIVKGVSLNGQNTFTDYGDYAEVLNMTSYDTPTVADGQVTWDLQNPDEGRFYYECIPSQAETMQLPWTFDVTYRLNGVQVTAEECAGAQGTVEITVQATPNADADEYYRNNMALMVTQGIDMSKNLSIDAPGAQVQSLGTYKTVLFMGLPGEECTFVTRIGSNDFDYAGTYMMMAPATGSQMDRIADLREAKDKLEDASDDLHQGMDSMLNTVQSMKSGIAGVQSGVSGLDAARQQVQAADAQNDANMDQALTDLQTMIDQMDASLPEMENSIQTMTDANNTMDSILDKLIESQSDLEAYKEDLQKLHENLTEMIEMCDDLAQMTYDNGDYDYVMKNVQGALSSMVSSSTALADSLSDLHGNLEQLAYDTASGTYSGDSMTAFLIIMQRMPSGLFSHLEDMMDAVALLSSSAKSTLTLVDSYVDTIEDHADDLSATLGTLNKLVAQAESTIDVVDSVMDDLPAMQETMNTGTQDITSMLQKSMDLLTSTKQTMVSTNKTIVELRQTLLSVRQQANDSTKQTVDGLLDVLQKALDSSASHDMQRASDTIYDTTNDEFDSLEDDTNVLNIDNSLQLQSFTSKENPAPSSLQFVVRTAEISPESVEKQIAAEPTTEDIGVWARIVNIFKKIASAVQSVFAED